MTPMAVDFLDFERTGAWVVETAPMDLPVSCLVTRFRCEMKSRHFNALCQVEFLPVVLPRLDCLAFTFQLHNILCLDRGHLL